MTIYGSNGAEMYRVSEHQQGALLELSNTYLATPRFRLESGWIDDGSSITLYTAGGLRGANLEAQEASGFSSGGLLELRDVSESGSQVVVRLRGQVGSTNQIFNATFMESLGINRYGSSNELEVGGDASKSAAGDWLANSDARIKTEVTTVRNALQTLNQVRPVTFHYRPEYLEQHPELRDIEYYNVIAQEFAEVFPDSVSEGGDTLSSGERVLQVDTHPAMMTALAAIQELHALVQAQEQRIAELESRLDPNRDQSHTSDLAEKGEFQ